MTSCGGVFLDDNWCKFPIMGNFGGPGGKFGFLDVGLSNVKTKNIGIKKRDNCHIISIYTFFTMYIYSSVFIDVA